MTLVRENYRGRRVTLLAGVLAVPALVAGAGVVALLGPARPGVAAAVAAACAGGVGVYDDLRGTPAARGLRGHLRALFRGRVTTGLVKLLVVGVGGAAAAVVLSGFSWRAVVDAVVVAGLANLLNLFDLRPGRALKVALLVAVPLLAARSAVAAVVVAVSLALLPGDLRERTMLGDGGANALGAVAGVAVAAASAWPSALAAAAVVVALTLASEVVSFSRVIEATPPLRGLDRLGRPA